MIKKYACSKYTGLRLSGGIKFESGYFETEDEAQQHTVEASNYFKYGKIKLVPNEYNIDRLRSVRPEHKAQKLEQHSFTTMADRIAEIEAIEMAKAHKAQVANPEPSPVEKDPAPPEDPKPEPLTLADAFDPEPPEYSATEINKFNKAKAQELAVELGIEPDQTVTKLKREIKFVLGV